MRNHEVESLTSRLALAACMALGMYEYVFPTHVPLKAFLLFDSAFFGWKC